MKRPLLFVMAAAVVCVLAGFAAAAAQAADVNVNPFRCQVFDGGNETVPAGSTITIRQGASEQTRGTLTAYLNAQTTTITVNGVTVDVSADWSDLVGLGPQGGWVSFVTHPTGITLGEGDSLSVVWTTTFAHPVPEVFNPAAGGPSGKPAFNADPQTYACTVTAV